MPIARSLELPLRCASDAAEPTDLTAPSRGRPRARAVLNAFGLVAALAMLAPALAQAAAPPSPNKGDMAWMLTSTALVLFMSVPALALFYGGLVRTKNMLSVLMQVFVGFSLITVLWCIYGYSLAFRSEERR